MAHINIEFTLFSAFYSPLISLMSGGFLQAEGLEADWTVSPSGVSAVKALEEGRADVIQSAPSQAFTTVAKGEVPTAIHFAQINEMDGFFITGRAADPDFEWKRLEGSEVILFGGGQPLAMFKYACHKAGIDFAKLKAELGWSPRYSFEAGLAATVKWYLDNRAWWEPLLSAHDAAIRRGLAKKSA